jgi:hypothetical protein
VEGRTEKERAVLRATFLTYCEINAVIRSGSDLDDGFTHDLAVAKAPLADRHRRPINSAEPRSRSVSLAPARTLRVRAGVPKRRRSTNASPSIGVYSGKAYNWT